MAYVVCTPSAAAPIKSYSPELMVLPYLPEQHGDAAAGTDEPTAVDPVRAARARAPRRPLPPLRPLAPCKPRLRCSVKERTATDGRSCCCRAVALRQAVVARAAARLAPWLSRATALVVGPGLGSDPLVCATATAAMRQVRAAPTLASARRIGALLCSSVCEG
jgi:ATP-dependent NAD(P)H-hydrate dehydratase